MNELIFDPEKQAAVSLRRRPLEADASTLKLASPEMPLLFPPPPPLLLLAAISIADLSHAGAESLLGVSIFSELTSLISASPAPPPGQTLHSRRKATKC